MPQGALRTAIDAVCHSTWRAGALVFLLAFATRVALLPVTPVSAESAMELGAVARSLAATGAFANPYVLPTGPTAHVPPILPGVLSLWYRMLGPTPAAEYARCFTVIVGYALMYALLPWVGTRVGLGVQAGLIGGILGALNPYQWPREVSDGWEEAWAGAAMALLMLALLRQWRGSADSWQRAAITGVGAGVAFHLAPSLLPVVLTGMAFGLWWRARDPRAWLMTAATAAGIIVACIPWAWRNYDALHGVFFVRSNFGLELRLANHEPASPSHDLSYALGNYHHPAVDAEEARKVATMGEAAYMAEARREAVSWIRAHPGEFVRVAALRVVYFWFGALHLPLSAAGITALTLLALAGAWLRWRSLTVPQRAALLIPLAAYPIVYYIVNFTSRYRVPVNWVLLVLAGSAIWRWIEDGRGSPVSPRTGEAAGGAA